MKFRFYLIIVVTFTSIHALQSTTMARCGAPLVATWPPSGASVMTPDYAQEATDH